MNNTNTFAVIAAILFLIAIIGAATGLKPIYSIAFGVLGFFSSGWSLVKFEEDLVV